jgi:hypothetical protein
VLCLLPAGIFATVSRISKQFGHCYTGCGENSQTTLRNIALISTAARGAIRFIEPYCEKQWAQEDEQTFTSITVCYREVVYCSIQIQKQSA